MNKTPPRYYGVTPQHRALKRGSYVFGIEKMRDVKEEIIPLHALHWNEVEEGFTPLTFDLAYDKYEAFEDRGQFLLFTTREADEFKLIGYLMCYMHRSNHAQQDLVAREDGMFLHADYRGSGAANGLLDYAETSLKKLGCKVLGLSSRHHAGGVNLTPWLTGRGYKLSAVVLVKELQ